LITLAGDNLGFSNPFKGSTAPVLPIFLRFEINSDVFPFISGNRVSIIALFSKIKPLLKKLATATKMGGDIGWVKGVSGARSLGCLASLLSML
jgi:hypothetical protein